MIQEYQAKTKAEKEEMIKRKETRREKRARINTILDGLMKRPTKPEAILPSQQLQQKLDEANLKRRAIESKYETRDKLYKELSEAMKANAKKKEIKKIQMKLKMNNLPTVLEDS